ncbi:unnamed protein product [Ilex paraguariensis]|uniref:MULE transposase domain-containing protein n=1 Tax=Ilex paraguariensis TaxID=185542 RepID=A0ABC8QZD2_9AQUA
MDGNHNELYVQLWDYIVEIKRTNPGSRIIVKCEENNMRQPTNRFKRLYCCLGPLKRGFLEECRFVICLDGCFLKSLCPGQLLATIGIDANAGFYPTAYAVAEKEIKHTWR